MSTEGLRGSSGVSIGLFLHEALASILSSGRKRGRDGEGGGGGTKEKEERMVLYSLTVKHIYTIIMM